MSSILEQELACLSKDIALLKRNNVNYKHLKELECRRNDIIRKLENNFEW